MASSPHDADPPRAGYAPPAWFDPARDAALTPGRLRGLVHPMRIRLLSLLQEDGPATATQLGRRVGQSSGVTSYHLRILAAHGFIVDDAERGTGRDRWWRARHRGTALTFRSPDDPGDDQTVALAMQYLRMVVDGYCQRILAGVDSLAAHRDELPDLPWHFGDLAVRLTTDEARALTAEVYALLERYRREPGDPDPRPNTVRAVFQFQVLPADDEPPARPADEEPAVRPADVEERRP